MYKRGKWSVLIDNGHGDDTPGKRSPVWNDGSQLFEWKFAREIAQGIQYNLDKLFNIYSELLVPEDTDIPIKERIRRANKFYDERDRKVFLISIHANAAPNPNTGTGWEAFTFTGKTKSDEICTILYNSATNSLVNLPDNDEELTFRIRSSGDSKYPGKEDNFGILRDTKCPAVLTENLFMDNERDCRFMMSGRGKTVIQNIHVHGIFNSIRYLEYCSDLGDIPAWEWLEKVNSTY